MLEYLIRKAEVKDIPFLADAVIAAEKGSSDKLSFATLFNLPEEKIRTLLIAMFEEEIDGCEFSLSSFLVAESQGEYAGALCAWIEGFEGSMLSAILKSNLILHTFPKESFEFFRTVSPIIKDILIDREPLTLQLEYMHITDKYVGMGIDLALLTRNEENALAKYPALKKSQCQVYKNNIFGIKISLKNGFKIIKSYKSDNDDIFDYLPFNEKLLMEKTFGEPE